MTPKLTIILLVVVCILAASVEAKKKRKGKKSGPEVQIVNGEEENSDQKCAKVCSGSTGRASTAFKDYSDGKNVYLDVDMSECGFAKIPNVVISVEGSSHHWNVLGSSSVYNTTPTTFRVYLNNGNAGLNKSLLDDKKWNIEWIAVGFTC